MDNSEYFTILIRILRPELAKIWDQDWDRDQEVGKIWDWDQEEKNWDQDRTDTTHARPVVSPFSAL